jgi:protease PrsW
MDILYLLALALAPGTAIGIYIYLKDHHEREPLILLLISFLYGGLSTAVTFLLSYPLHAFLLTKPEDLVSQFINAFFKVALIEELSKFLFVRFILFKNRNFNEPFDGIVYAVMVSMGFATLENVLYVYNYGFMTGLLRMFTAVPAHGVFGIMMGFYLGRAKFTASQQIYFSLMALLIPTLFHGAYDYFWFIAEIKGVYTGIWAGSIAALLLGFVLSRKAIRIHQSSSPFRELASKNEEPLSSDPKSS